MLELHEQSEERILIPSAVGRGAHPGRCYANTVSNTLTEAKASSLLKSLQGQKNWPRGDCAGSDHVDLVTVGFLMTLSDADGDWLESHYQRDLDGWPTKSLLEEVLSKRGGSTIFGPVSWGNAFGI